MAGSAKIVGICSCKNTMQWRKILTSKNYYNWSNTRQLSASAGQKAQSVAEQEADIKPRKKRDRYTVLRVLASTVDPTPGKPQYGFYDDPILNPRSAIKKREARAAIQAGKDAADYVIKQYPELFRLREPVPAWPDPEKEISTAERNVGTLLYLIEDDTNIVEAISLYNELKETDSTLDIDVHNQMLDFVAFHAVLPDGNKDTSRKWSDEWYAEKLFQELQEVANSKTYESFILALLRHGELQRAFQIFNELAGKGFTGSTFLCNQLLEQVSNMHDDDESRWDAVQEIIDYMKKYQVHPDLVTFNTMLEIASNMTQSGSVTAQKLIREMKRLKIEPSLGSYYYLMSAEKKERMSNIQILSEVVSDLKKQGGEFTLQHHGDILFFETAMGVARYKRSTDRARDLFKLALRGDNKKLLGSKSSAFFGHYLCTIAYSDKSMDTIMEEYEKVVPKLLTPREWVYEDFFRACTRLGDPTNIPRLYKDMVTLRVRLNENVCNALFSALCLDIPAERGEEFLTVATECAKWMEVFEIPVSAPVMSSSISLQCVNENYEVIEALFEKCKKLNVTPSMKSLQDVLQMTLKIEDKSAVLATLKTIADFHYGLPEEQLQALISHPLLQDKQDKINSIFADS